MASSKVCRLFPDGPLPRHELREIEVEEVDRAVDWSSGVDGLTIIRKKGERQQIKGERSDTTRAHWKNFLHCVRTREKPVRDVEFGFQVQVALNMAMLAFLEKKVARFDVAKEEILLG